MCYSPTTYVGQTKVEMVKHFQEKKFQCLLGTIDAFIIEEEKDYWKRRTKEAIYSIIRESINTHDEINTAWTSILHKKKE
ncbi:unnamed protein product [Rotaria sordida]|uniref:Uncharacterized protein n=1 Tax=Rotaria sordida TaxID=392033 RepID=A0A814XB41_9BILA|nr:unnamed protein product [Rotaria sordida]